MKRKTQKKEYYKANKTKYQARYQENREEILGFSRQVRKELQEEKKQEEMAKSLRSRKWTFEKDARKYIDIWKKIREHDLQRIKDTKASIDSKLIENFMSFSARISQFIRSVQLTLAPARIAATCLRPGAKSTVSCETTQF